MDFDIDRGFHLAMIEFGDLVYPEARFSFGDSLKPGGFALEIQLGSGVDIEEAIALAAEGAAAEFRAWAKEAEDFAARTRAGSLRQPATSP